MSTSISSPLHTLIEPLSIKLDGEVASLCELVSQTHQVKSTYTNVPRCSSQRLYHPEGQSDR